MANERVIIATGRIEQALSRLERYKPLTMPASENGDLAVKLVRLKAETRVAVEALDSLLAKHGGHHG